MKLFWNKSVLKAFRCNYYGMIECLKEKVKTKPFYKQKLIKLCTNFILKFSCIKI